MGPSALFNGRGRVVSSRFAATTRCHVHHLGQIKCCRRVMIDGALWLRMLIFLTRMFLFLWLGRATTIAVIFVLEAYLARLTIILSGRWRTVVISLEVEREGTSQTTFVITTIWRHHMIDPITRFLQNRSDSIYSILIFILDRDAIVIRAGTRIINCRAGLCLVLHSRMGRW